MNAEVPANLVSPVRKAKCSITLKEYLNESDRELLKTQRELQVASGSVLEAQHLALRKSEKARSCCQQSEDLGEQLDSACEKAICVEAASAAAAVRLKGELARLLEECDLNRQRTGTAESAVTVPHKAHEVVMVKVSDLLSEIVTLQKEFEKLSTNYAA